MSETPSQEIAANKVVSTKDRRGRSIEVKKLKTLDRMRLVELVGAANAANEQYLGFAMLAYCVTKIDGNLIGRPATKLALEAIVQELDDDGFDAVSKAFVENFMDGASADADIKETAKNG